MGFIQTGAGGIGSGNQTVEGVKTFVELPLLVDLPTKNEEAANKLYVDTVAGGGPGGGVQKRIASWPAGTSITVEHNLGTTDITVGVYEVTSGDIIMVPARVIDVNSVQLTSSEAPPAGGWRVVIIG